jgi:hypothetical protein
MNVAGKVFHRTTQWRKIDAGSRAVGEDPPFFHVPSQDAVHIVFNGQDEAGTDLGLVLIILGLDGLLLGRVPTPVAVGVRHAYVEPDRRVEASRLGQHQVR